MHKLVRKNEKWNWGAEQEKAFEQLKRVFTMQPVLVAPDCKGTPSEGHQSHCNIVEQAS